MGSLFVFLRASRYKLTITLWAMKSRNNSCPANLETSNEHFQNMQSDGRYSLSNRRLALTTPLTKREINRLNELHTLEKLRKVSKENGYKAMHPLALANRNL